jgi:heme oxygenase
VQLGRKKGTLGSIKLDKHKAEIKKFLEGGINKTNLARYYGVSWYTMDSFIRTRKLVTEKPQVGQSYKKS